jgi:hypothetical protein
MLSGDINHIFLVLADRIEAAENYLGIGANSGKKKGTTEAVPLNPCRFAPIRGWF